MLKNDTNHLNKAPKLFREDCEIDWSQDAEGIVNKIRGLSPYPAAWTTLVNHETGEEYTFKIYKALINGEIKGLKPGEISTNNKDTDKGSIRFIRKLSN